jgi:DNA-binding NtrC family response regulator
VLARGSVITPADLPALAPVAARPPPSEPEEGTLQESVESYERELLRRSLVQARGVKAEAARLLGIPAATLHYKLQKYGIET